MKFIYCLLLTCFLAQYSKGQCFPDRHNTTWHDGWISCKQQANPNGARDVSHWILYNFGEPYALRKMQIWNTNDPQNLDRGMRNIVVDYSMDGNTWSELGFFEIPQAGGRSDYEGIESLDFAGKQAQYVLITGVDNYGGDCYGLSEVRFETTDEVSSEMTTPVDDKQFCVAVNVYPNPFTENPTLDLHSNCSSELSYFVTDAVGRTVHQEKMQGLNRINQALNMRELLPGMYFLNVQYGSKTIKEKLVKMN